ncbi:MAG: GAF domain-containing protein, partial [Blastochloris sp.]|nr:GAF domain-containing protein [Blastochloris sp.]
MGVLSVMTAERREFSSDEMMVLVGLASQAAIAMENARLFQERDRRIKELTTINQISVAVNGTLELDDLLLALHRNISAVLDTRYSLIALYEETRLDAIESALVLRVMRNDDQVHLSEQTAIIDGKGLLDYVVLTSAPLLLQTPDDIYLHVSKWHTHHNPDDMQLEQLSALHMPFACWLGVPIMVGHDVLGIINLQSSEPFAYNADDLRFLSTVASQAAVAIANARLFAERERRLRELSVLKDIGSAISSTMDLQVVLENLRHELAQAIDVATMMIGLYDEATSIITYNVCYDQSRRVHITPSRILPESNSANSWVIRNRQPLLLHNIEQARQIGFSDFGFSMFDLRSGQTLQRLPQSRHVQSCLAVPIISGDSVLGVINIQSYNEYAFDQDDLRFVMTVANQTAVTIANIYLFIERGRRIEELATFNEIGRALSATVNVEKLPELVYRQASRLLNTTNFYMAVIDEEHGEVVFPLFYDNGVAYTMSDQESKPQRSSYIGAYRFPPPPTTIRYWPLITRLTERVINLGEPLIVHGADVERSGWV